MKLAEWRFPFPPSFPRARKLTEHVLHSGVATPTALRACSCVIHLAARKLTSRDTRSLGTRTASFAASPRLQISARALDSPTLAQDASQREGVAGVQGLGRRLWRAAVPALACRRAVFVPEDAVVIRSVLRGCLRPSRRCSA